MSSGESYSEYHAEVMDKIKRDSDQDIKKLRNKVAATIIISFIIALVNYFWFFEDVNNWILKPVHRVFSGIFKPDEKLDSVSDPGSALHVAAEKGDIDEIESLLKEGVDINAFDKMMFAPLHRAAAKGQYMSARILLDKGANVNIRNKYGVVPLHCAAQQGDTEMVKLLVSRGANVSAPTLGGDTPLDLAREKGYYDVCKILKDHGARGLMPPKN